VVHQKNLFLLKEAALILNPLGGKNLREAPLLFALAKHVGLEVKIVKDFWEIEQTIEKLVFSKRILLVSGGDGTISAVLTACFRKKKVPALAILPGGTTNLIAWDVSRPSGQLRSFQRFLKGFPPRIKKRKVLKIWPPNLYSMFCGAGLLAEGVKLYNKRRSQKGLRGLRNALPVALQVLTKGLPSPKQWPRLKSYPRKIPIIMITTLERVFLPIQSFLKKPCPDIKVGIFARTFIPFSVLCEKEIELETYTLAVDGELVESKEGRFVIQSTEEIEFFSW